MLFILTYTDELQIFCVERFAHTKPPDEYSCLKLLITSFLGLKLPFGIQLQSVSHHPPSVYCVVENQKTETVRIVLQEKADRL